MNIHLFSENMLFNACVFAQLYTVFKIKSALSVGIRILPPSLPNFCLKGQPNKYLRAFLIIFQDKFLVTETLDSIQTRSCKETGTNIALSRPISCAREHSFKNAPNTRFSTYLYSKVSAILKCPVPQCCLSVLLSLPVSFLFVCLFFSCFHLITSHFS